MDNPKTDLYYAEKIRSDLAFIVKQMKGTDLLIEQAFPPSPIPESGKYRH